MTQVRGRGSGSRSGRRGACCGVASSSCVAAAAAGRGAQTREAIRYTLRFPAPQTNYVEVEAIVPTDGRPSIDLMMAVWTPGSYLIREYERNVEAVQASAGLRRPGPRSADRKDDEEPLADHDRRRARGDADATASTRTR